MGCCASAHQALEALEPVFRPIRRLGRGTFADVWLCEAVHSGEKVAVKLIKRGFDDFQAQHISYEIQLQSLVASPHVVGLKQLLLTRAHLGLVLEYVPSGTLDRYCKAHPPDEEMARYLLRQMVVCVSFLHGMQVVHRDLKLQNILVAQTESGLPRLKLIDFGCAKRWKRRTGKSSQFHTAYMGTPAYMSPQLLQAGLRGSGNYDGVKVDVWCLGVMLVQMFASCHVPYSMDDYKYEQAMGEHFGVLERLRDMERGKWKDTNPTIAAAAAGMSAPLLDLLDRIFDPMESTRINLPGIQAHPWVAAPLPERYEAALGFMVEEEKSYPTQPKMIVDPVKGAACAPDAATGRYDLVDDIVRMAARGRYVPKLEGGSGGLMVYNISGLGTNLDISVTGPGEAGADKETEAGTVPAVGSMTQGQCVEAVARTDPSTHGGSHFHVLVGGAENRV
mmetsp:Transcript_4741/g.11879  ORF Transcript_4741/g.11879 Transcript_4741/m.11879 type:complete len:448 (+) Transcript_4741:393-1736(+)